MTDPLDDLKSAFDRATPAPDPARLVERKGCEVRCL